MQLSFTRHRYELPTLLVFLAIALIELFAVHLLVSLWSPVAAWVLSALTVLMLGQIAFLIHGMVQWPTLVDDRGIIIRHGRRGEIVVPFGAISGIEDVAFRPEEKGPGTFRATLLAQPNIAVRLAHPLHHRGRALSTVTMRLDDPASFHTSVSARLAGGAALHPPGAQAQVASSKAA